MYWLCEMISARPARHLEAGQGDDEGLEPEAVRDQALDGAEGQAREHDRDQRRHDAPAGVHHQRRGQHAREAEHRADREVDAAGDDHEGHAERDDPGLRDGAHDVGDVVRRQEQELAVPARGEDDAADEDQEEPDDALEADDDARAGRATTPARRAGRPERRSRWSCPGSCRLLELAVGGGQQGRLVAVPCVLGDGAAAPHDHDPVAQPRQLRQLAGRDQHAQALRGERAQLLVDLGLGAHVDAARRLVQEEQARGRSAAPSRTPPSAGCRPTGCRPARSPRGGRMSELADRALDRRRPRPPATSGRGARGAAGST